MSLNIIIHLNIYFLSGVYKDLIYRQLTKNLNEYKLEKLSCGKL